MTDEVRLSFFGMDPRSTVLLRAGRILRTGVDAGLSDDILADPRVRQLIADGHLIDAMLARDVSGDWVLEHRRIDPFTYPGEWSFSMLRDAALTTLDVRDALVPGGFDLKDAHSYNVSFDRCRPVFVDFASIVRADPRYRFWRAGAEYADAFVRILKIWSRTNRTCALSFLNAVWARAEDERLIRRGPAMHALRSRVGRAYRNALIATAMTSDARREAMERYGLKGIKRAVAPPMLETMGILQRLTGHPFSTPRLRRATLAQAPPVDATMWARYQDELALHRELTPRFRRIVELVAGLGARDAYEVAGNQGALSEALLAAGAVSSVVCSDSDEHAIDALYRRIKAKGGARITPLVRNVMMPEPIRCHGGRDLAGDVVLALALTHHLLLTQGYRLDAVLERIAAHGRRHMIIEFMPKGLWYQGSGPPVPAWYTQQWFAHGLERVGRVLLCERLEENRVVFVVELGDARPRSQASG
jgi:hypothetical protein